MAASIKMLGHIWAVSGQGQSWETRPSVRLAHKAVGPRAGKVIGSVHNFNDKGDLG